MRLIPENEAVLFNWPCSNQLLSYVTKSRALLCAWSVRVFVTFASANNTSRYDYLSSDDHVPVRQLRTGTHARGQCAD